MALKIHGKGVAKSDLLTYPINKYSLSAYQEQGPVQRVGGTLVNEDKSSCPHRVQTPRSEKAVWQHYGEWIRSWLR